MRTALWILVASLVVGGCVSSGKHEELKAKYDAAQASLTQEQSRSAGLEQSLSEQQRAAAEQQRLAAAKAAEDQAQIALLTRQRGEHAQQVADAIKDNERLSAELAGLIKDRSRLKDSTQRLQQAVADLARRKAEADRRVAEFRALLERFKGLIDAGQLRVQILDGRMVLTLPSDVLFDSGSARLSKPGKATLASVAQVLATMPDRRFQIEGHTDNVPISNAQYASNWELASARALIVVKTMTDAGMPAQTLSAASYGQFHPVTDNATEMDRKVNRRIEIVIVPDLSSLPGFEELNQVVKPAS